MMSQTRKKSSYGFKIYPGTDESSFRYTFYMDPPDIRVLSFKGGGSRVIVYNKFVEIMHEKGLLEKVEEVGGSSSGCIASAFAAIHYENPLRRTQALEEISRIKKEDVYSKSKGWKVYRVLTSPLLIISKPFEWVGDGINRAGDKLNKTIPGKFIGIPLKFISFILRAVSALTSPKSYVAVGNLLTGGGVYHGDNFQNHVRDRIQSDTQAGLEAILSKLDDLQRVGIVHRLVDEGVCTLENGQLKVVPDVTFKHFYILSQLPGSQFKQYYTTVFRKRDKQMVVLNKDSAPDMPVHLGMRLAVTFPTYFQTKSYLGDKYVDGGIIDNSPVEQAVPKPVSSFKSEHGVRDNLARLNVRVEYPEEHQYLLWKRQPKKSGLAKLLFPIKRALTKRFTSGVDIFDTDAEVTRTIQDDYAQRTFQIEDFGIGQLVKNIGAEQRERIEKELPALVQDYFDNHANEKAVIENYQRPEIMPPDVRRKLLKVLCNPEIKAEEIFELPDKSAQELEALRVLEIEKLNRQSSHTAMIFRELSALPVICGEIEEMCELPVVSEVIDAAAFTTAIEEKVEPDRRRLR